MKEFLSARLLILTLFDLKEAKEAYHRHEIRFTVEVTGRAPMKLLITHMIDDVPVCSYDKHDGKLVFKDPQITKTLGTEYIKEHKKTIIDIETNFQSLFKYYPLNETMNHIKQIVQLFADCEMNNDIQMSSNIKFALNGELIGKTEDDHWVFIPEAEQFKIFLQSGFQTNVRKHYMQVFCFNMMKKILQYSNMKKNVDPEVNVSHHNATDDRVTFSCTARGFYPRYIQLFWKKNGKLGSWGKERSSGILPNMDSTFYLQITLEPPPGDSETGYECVMKHSKLKTPTLYSVPRKPTMEKTWVLTLSAGVAVIILLFYAGAIGIWKEWRTT